MVNYKAEGVKTAQKGNKQQINDIIMEVKDFIIKVKLMRQAQKDYFAYRTKELLARSKELEREVDNDLVTIAKMFA